LLLSFDSPTHVFDFQLLHDGSDGLRSALVEQKAQFLLVFLRIDSASISPLSLCVGQRRWFVCHLEVYHHWNVDRQRRRLRVDALQRTHRRRAHLCSLLATAHTRSARLISNDVVAFEQKRKSPFVEVLVEMC
jgi:hypothetical protein